MHKSKKGHLNVPFLFAQGFLYKTISTQKYPLHQHHARLLPQLVMLFYDNEIINRFAKGTNFLCPPAGYLLK